MSRQRSLPFFVRLRGRDRVVSLRLIATLAVAGLVAGTMLTIARVTERYTKNALLTAAESRLILEARNLALLSEDALLSEFPELTLVPVVKDVQASHPEIPLVVIVDHRGTIQGHADPRLVGQTYEPPARMTARRGAGNGSATGLLKETDSLIVAESIIRHPQEGVLGRALVGIEKTHLAKQVHQVRSDLLRYAAVLLPAAMVLAALMMSFLLRPIPALRAGLERIGRGDLDSPMKIADVTELGLLARSINKMASQLKISQAITRERELEIVETQKEIIHTLGDVVETRSSETANHTTRVAAMSQRLAELAGLPDEEANIIRLASPMHDVGKIGIPDSILNKPGKLTAEEYELMKTHAEIGYGILAKSDRAILKAAAIIAHEHHEKWDGSGYPRGLAGQDIHIYGRIVAIVDVFDAVYSDRVYRPAMPLDQVLEIIRTERGAHFEPRLVDLFLGNLDEFLRIHGQYSDLDDVLASLMPVADTVEPEPELLGV